MDAATETFTWLFNSVLDLHAPIKTIQNRKHYVPYITPEINNLMAQRNDYKIMTCQSDDPAIEAQYKLLRNKVTEKLRNAERDYYRNKFREVDSSDSKQVWQTVKESIGSVRS